MTALSIITPDQEPRPWATARPDRPAALSLCLLGGYTCRDRGREVDLPLGAQQLMAFLALHGPSTRSAVAGSLWPEVTEVRALANLRTRVWRIRKCLPRALRTHGQIVALGAETWVDSQALDALAASLLHHTLTDTAALLDGLGLLRAGDLLPGWDDEWVTLERERLRQLRLQALESSVQVLLRAQEPDVALDLALQAVKAEPLRESAYAALIRVHLAEGNVAEARRQFGVCSALLQRELGVAPSDRLTALDVW